MSVMCTLQACKAMQGRVRKVGSESHSSLFSPHKWTLTPLFLHSELGARQYAPT